MPVQDIRTIKEPRDDSHRRSFEARIRDHTGIEA